MLSKRVKWRESDSVQELRKLINQRKVSNIRKAVQLRKLSIPITQTTIPDFASRSSEDPKDSEDTDHNSWRDLDTDSDMENMDTVELLYNEIVFAAKKISQ